MTARVSPVQVHAPRAGQKTQTAGRLAARPRGLAVSLGVAHDVDAHHRAQGMRQARHHETVTTVVAHTADNRHPTTA